jgi:hypothetical protein
MIAVLRLIAQLCDLFLPESMALWLAKKWAVNDALPKTIDLVVPVAPGSTTRRITTGSFMVASEALGIGLDCGANIVFGSFAGNKDPDVERTVRDIMFQLMRKVYVGRVWSTVEECVAVKKAVGNSAHQNIVIITDEAHSRRCRMIWRTIFPESKIYIAVVPLVDCVDAESPMETYHSVWKAFVFQVVPTPVFWWWCRKGPDYLATKAAGYHQPVCMTR